jgi:prepilin-type N-terminal cleavage/methylation domain-containing protein
MKYLSFNYPLDLRPLPLKGGDHKGFTLIELLVYISILAILLLAFGAVLFNTLYGKAKLETVQEVGQNARRITEHIADRVRNAQSITAPAQGQSGASLTLVMSDSAMNPTVYDLLSGAVRVKEGAGAATALSTDEVTITNLTFTNVSYPNKPGAVRIQITVQSSSTSGRQEYSHSETFYTTATIRPR